MALYHCSIQIIGRSGGKSAVASAAYRSGEKLYDERTGLTHDFTKKRGVVFMEVSLPAHAPPEYADRNVLWNAVEKQKGIPMHSLQGRLRWRFQKNFQGSVRLKL